MLRDFDLTTFLITLPIIIISLTTHEYCHALASYKLGDNTAKSEGRLTINPIKHIDPMGFIMLLILGFGWAKPVHYDPRALKNVKKDAGLIALAGPTSNFLLAFISLLLIPPITILLGTQGVFFYILIFFYQLAWINIVLGVFNLMPIPPLDGSKVVGIFLPDNLYNSYVYGNKYANIIFIILIFTGVISKVIMPICTVILNFFLYYN